MTGPQGMGPLRPMSKVVAVTIDQAPGQTDPTGANHIYFIVEFSEVVTGFGIGDVTISGTALGDTVSVSGVGSTYLVGISGMTVYGTVIIDIPAGVVTGISGNTNSASVAIDNSVVWDPSLADVPVFLNVSAVSDGGLISSSTLGSGDGIEQAVVFCVACVTRLNAGESTGIYTTTDGYSAGSAGLDGFGGAAGRGLLKQSFGTRSHIEIRQDFLSFYGGDEYRVSLNASDHSHAAAFYRCPPTWKIRQVASGTTSTTSLSATFANPVAPGSKVVVGIATLSGVTVSGGPVGGVSDGTAFDATDRTSRMTVYRIPNMPGDVTRSVTLSGSGGAMVMVEFDESDIYTAVLRTAIRAQADLIGYYPLNHTMAGFERNCSPTVTLGSMSNVTNFNTMFDAAGPDGRSYATHASSGSNNDVILDNNEFTPAGNGGLTVGLLVKPDSFGALQTMVSKNTDASNFSKEWEIYYDTNGSITARTCINFAVPPASARQRTTPPGILTVDVWHLVIVRFGNGAADYPSIRVDGQNIVGTISGGSSANGNSAAHVIYGAAYQNNGSRAMSAAGGHLFFCTTAISDSECALIEAAAYDDLWILDPVSVTIDQGSGQSDPVTDTIPVSFDVVFSEAVTGFAAAGVSLSGTAVGSTTLPTVVDSGDHIHFTVNVNGMIGNGTVIATVLAGYATSIATGVINASSNSTDNTVTYNATAPTIVDAGVANQITGSTTLLITTTQAMAVGDQIVVCVSGDNAGTNGASAMSTCTDPSGNVYTLRVHQNRDPGNANDGHTVAMWVAPCTVALGSGSTITVTFTTTMASRAGLVKRIRPTNSNGTFPSSLFLITGGANANTTPALAVGSCLPNDIIVACIGRESNAAVTGDADSTGGASWSTILTETANTGSVLTSSQISAQHKVVVSAAAQTWDPTYANCDCAWGAVVFRQVMG